MSRAGAIDIAILTGSHLCRNPRVVKEANALAEAGYTVSVLSVWTRKDWLQLDRTLLHPDVAYDGIDLTDWTGPKSVFLRLVKRAFGEMNRIFNMESIHSLNYGLPALSRLAKKQRAALYIAHQETGLAIGCRLLNEKYKVAFDLEDWYSKDLLPEARQTRPVKLLEEMERQALHHGAFAVTTSGAMAYEMGRYFQCPPPQVILNVFPRQETAFLRNAVSPLRLIWFSQTIGPGRGLEEMLDSISSLEDVRLEIHLLGDIDPGYRSRLGELVRHPDNHRLFFHPIVPPAELNRTLSRYDAGLALERPFRKAAT
ncbi:MAG: hypothetical protein IPG32_10130 [Saprospirales bacterium]|nr:hypothetical protein [Saprospirales bacterium]